MKITKSQLKEIIKEEISRLQKKTILENRKKEINKELASIINEDESANEGIGDIFKSKATKEKEALEKQNSEAAEKKEEDNRKRERNIKSLKQYIKDAEDDLLYEPGAAAGGGLHQKIEDWKDQISRLEDDMRN